MLASFVTGPRAIFILSLCLRSAYLLSLYLDPVMSQVKALDSVIYLERAASILAGDCLGKEPLFYSGIFYPYMLALTGAYTPAILIIQALMDSFSSVFVYLLARSLFGTIAGTISGVLYAISAIFIFASGTVLYDPWVTFFTLLGVFLVGLAARQKDWRAWIGAGLAIALASTARPFLLLYVPLVMMCWVIPVYHPSRRDLFYSLAGTFLGIVIVFTPIVYRNLKVDGHPSPFPSGSGFAFYIGNNPLSDGTLVIPKHLGVENETKNYASSTMNYPSMRLGRKVSPAEASSFWFREGLRFWTTSTKQAFLLTGRKLFMLVNRAEISDNYDFYLFRDHFWILRWLSDSSIIIPLGLIGVLISAFRWRLVGFILILTGIYIMFLPLSFMSARFRYPFVALLAVFAGYAVSKLLEELKQRNLYRVGAISAGLIVSSVLCFLPVTMPKKTVVIRKILAQAYLSAGDQYAALQIVDAALKEDENADLYLLKAKILISRGSMDAALSFLRKGVDLNPSLAEAHSMIEQICSSLHDPQEYRLRRETEGYIGQNQGLLRLAEYYIVQKRYYAAIDSLQRLLGKDSQSDEAMFMLAVAYSLCGEVSKSITLYERLAVMKPDNPVIAANLGFAYFDNGQFDKAEQNFYRAIALNSENRIARYGLGLVYKFTGAFEKARQQFNLFLSTEPPQSVWSYRAKKNIEELEYYTVLFR